MGDDTRLSKLTERNVLTLPLRDQPYQQPDVGPEKVTGLHVLVNPSGTRTYRIQYRLHGVGPRKSLSLGRVGELSLEEARELALAARRKARKGEDPQYGDGRKSDAFDECLTRWIREKQASGDRCRTAEDTLQFVLKSCKVWKGRPIATITSDEIKQLVNDRRDYGHQPVRGKKKDAAKGSPHSANRLYAHLKTFFSWCQEENLVSVTPMTMKRPWRGNNRRHRDWFEGTKADDLIRALWKLADDFGDNRGVFLKLLIITGKRLNAVIGMRWEHIDDKWFWRPPKGSENKRNHAIPLPKLARRVMGERRSEGRVFKHCDERSVAYRCRRHTHVKDFFFHGLRHIAETKCAELKVPPHIRNNIFDHKNPGMGAHYDHHAYRDEMAEALERWCDHIERLAKPEPNWKRNLQQRAERQRAERLQAAE